MAETPLTGQFTPGVFTSSDGYRSGYRRYEPDGPPRGTLVFIHGIQSHAGWYGGTCEFFRQAGWRVLFLDRRGSGVNEVARGDCPSFRRLLDDIAEFARAEKTTGPHLLAAISWGGKLAAALPYRHAGVFDGVALICPGITATVTAPFSERLAVFWVGMVRPRKLYPIPLADPALFTDSPGWREYIAADPLALHQATARFLWANSLLGIYLWRAKNGLRMPTLLMLAGKDRVVDNAGLRRFWSKLPTGDRTLIEYPEASHTLEFEPDPDRYRTDLLTWAERIAGR